MSIYFDPNDPFVLELKEHIKNNPISDEQLLIEGYVKPSFPMRYNPLDDPEIESERKAKISQTLKGRKPHENSLKNLEGTAFWKNKKMPLEVRKKMSESRLGKIGLKHTDEAKEKMRLAKLGKKRQPHSEETKRKMSEAKRKIK